MRYNCLKMSILFFVLMVITFGFFTYANAVEKQFSGAWNWYGNEADIQGFRIKDQHNNVVVNTDMLNSSARQGTGTINVAAGDCLSLFVVAVDLDGEESGNSNIINYCLPKPKTIRVEAFDITILD